MTTPTAARWGPVELMILTFPSETVDASVASAFRSIIDSGHVTVLDLAVVVRQGDGSLVWLDEVAELERVGLAEVSPPDSNVLFSEDDLHLVEDDLAPGSCAVLVVYEESWARGVAEAVGQAGGQVALHAQITRDALEAAFAPAP